MGKDIYKVSGRIICKIGNRLDLSETKATLSHLRNSIGRDLSETFAVWPLMFEEVPQEYLSRSGKPSYQENSILSSLQLYALHQQGKNKAVHDSSGDSVGKALSNIRDAENVALDRRFNAMIVSSSFKELTTHLRHLISILKSTLKQKADIKIDYAKLAEDLYWYQVSEESANRMRMRWGQDYYFPQEKKEEEDE